MVLCDILSFFVSDWDDVSFEFVGSCFDRIVCCKCFINCFCKEMGLLVGLIVLGVRGLMMLIIVVDLRKCLVLDFFKILCLVYFRSV